MIPLYSSEASRFADERALSLGYPSIVLMENAGRGAAEAILREVPRAARIGILVGPGNNGGDALVVARHLVLQASLSPALMLALPPERLKGDARTAWAMLSPLSLPVSLSSSLSDSELRSWLASKDLVVDGLLGTGSGGEPRGEVLRMIRGLNGLRKTATAADRPRVAALDLPSGVDGSTGVASEDSLGADFTISFLGHKVGNWISPGAFRAGRVQLAGIGASPDLLPSPEAILLGPADLAQSLPRRGPETHKGKRGRLLILGGSERYRGAPLLAAQGALRSGAGLVVLAVPNPVAALAGGLPEAILQPVGPGWASETFESAIRPWYDRVDAIVAGPGMGRSPEGQELIRRLWRTSPLPLLVDADGLSALADPSPMSRREDAILTPHPGEAARLLNCTASAVQERRLEAVRSLAERFGTILLKGYRTLVAGGGECRVIGAGGPALAVPGSGDVLSGIVGAFLAAGAPPLEAASAGALAHACAGDELDRRIGSEGLLAGEIAAELPRLWGSVLRTCDRRKAKGTGDREGEC